MLTADYFRLFGLVLIGAFSLVVFLWARRFIRRPVRREPQQAPSVKVIAVGMPREISERQPRWHTLTRREKDVAELAACDKTDDEIASELSISVRTVESHLYHAYHKLQIRSRHELKYLIQQLED